MRARLAAARRTRWPGASPSSSRPRRWTATAATGGRRTARPCWPPGSTTARCSAGTSPTRRTRSQPGRRGALPGRRQRRRRGHLAPARPRRQPHRRRRGTARRYPYLVRASGRPAGAVLQVMSRDQQHGAGAGRRPGDRGDVDAVPSSRTRSGSTPSSAYPPCCRTAGSSSPPSVDGARRLVVDGEPGHRHRHAGRARSLSVDDDGVLLAGTDDPVEGHLWRWSPDGGRGAADRTGRLPHRRCAPAAPLVVAEPAAPARRCRSSTVTARPAARAAVVTSYAETAAADRRRRSFFRVGDARPRGRARAAAGPRARHAAAGADGPLRRPAPPRGARHAGALAARRSGSPTRASRSSRSTAAAPAAAAARGTARSATSWRRSPWTTRSRRCTAVAEEVPDLDLSRVGDPRLVVRRLPGRAGRAAPPGRLPRRRRRRAGHRLAALRHLLHRALPRRTRTRQPEVYDAQLAARRRRRG